MFWQHRWRKEGSTEALILQRETEKYDFIPKQSPRAQADELLAKLEFCPVSLGTPSRSIKVDAVVRLGLLSIYKTNGMKRN